MIKLYMLGEDEEPKSFLADFYHKSFKAVQVTQFIPNDIKQKCLAGVLSSIRLEMSRRVFQHLLGCSLWRYV